MPIHNNQSFEACKILIRFFKTKKPIAYENLSGRTYNIIKGVLRWHDQLKQVIHFQCKKPPKNDSVLEILMLVGLYQKFFLNFNSRTEILLACKHFGLSRISGFLDAVIMRAKLPAKLEFLSDCFFKTQIQHDWPHKSDYLMLVNLNSAPNTIRIIDKDKFLQTNKKHQSFSSWLIEEDLVLLPENVLPQNLKGFLEGEFYIQGAYFQILQKILTNKNNIKILDACCGVGGKSFILRDKYSSSCQIILNDSNPKQICKLKSNIERLGGGFDKIYNFKLAELPENEFDLIILDVPCSDSGNIRKHPELLFRITEKEIKRINIIQTELLYNAWDKLRVGGELIYMTCSIFKQENANIISKFLEHNKNAKSCVMDFAKSSNYEADEFGLQILPNEIHSGFFFSIIKKLK